MSQPWSPEIEMTSEKAKQIIEAQFPQLRPVTIRELGTGFDNSVFTVNEEYVFRFPRREVAVQLLLVENQLLPLLVNKLAIKIPEPIFFGEPSEDFKWPFTGYHHVEGKAPGKLGFEVRNQSAAPLAHFMKQLHQFPIEHAEKMGIPHDRFGRMDIPRRREMIKENIKKAVDLQLIEDAETALKWLESMKDLPLHSELTLVHGDCHIRNILVDENGIISGVIDWGDTHIGNPSIDLSIAYSFLPTEGREQFFNIYGEVTEGTKQAARFFALYVSVLLLLYGHDLKDERLVSSAKESIKLSLS